MNESLRALAAIGGEALGSDVPDAELPQFLKGALCVQLAELLSLKNGFYAFESALHVFPVGTVGTDIDLAAWNSEDLWKGEFDGMAVDCVFFGEDIFGSQFCVHHDEVCTFDPETGDIEVLASSVYDWADIVREDYPTLTGHPLAREWQLLNGPLSKGDRLIPKTPFVCGGEFTVDNLYAIEAAEGMRFRASIARQIRDLPDGSAIRLDVR